MMAYLKTTRSYNIIFHAFVLSVTYYISIPSNSTAYRDEKCFCKNEYLFTFRTFICTKVQSDMFRVWCVIISFLLARAKCFGPAWAKKHLYAVRPLLSAALERTKFWSQKPWIIEVWIIEALLYFI